MLKLVAKHINILLSFFLMAILIVTGFFLYENFYKTYIQADEVLILQQQVSPVVFKEKSWERVMGEIDKRLKPREIPSNLPDPFFVDSN